MAIFIGAVLAALSIAVVLYPFFKARGSSPATPAPAEATNHESPELESIYDAIRTLRLEHQLGNVPRGLYLEQLAAYRVQAALALKQQMETTTRDADWALEQEILVARASLGQSNGHTAHCDNCGSALNAALAQCPECNAEQQRPGGGGARGPRQP